MHVWLWDRRHRSLTSNNPIRRNLMVLNRTIQGANSDHRNERVHNQEMSRAVINRFIDCTARGIVLLKPCHIILVTSISSNFGGKNRVIAISSTVNGCSLTSLVLKKVWFDDAFCPKSAPNGDTLWVHFFFANHTWLLRNPNPIKN